MSLKSPTEEEIELMNFLEKKCKKSVIHLGLRPDGYHTIVEKELNLCTVELNSGKHSFKRISESFYDHMVALYHNKPQLINR